MTHSANTSAQYQEIADHIAAAAAARSRVLALTSSLDDGDGAWPPAAGQWSAREIVEHLVLAEQSGVQFIWLAAAGVRGGAPLWSGDPVHRGQSIEAVIAGTWRFKEEAPANATPKAAAPLAYWRAVFAALQPVLDALGLQLDGLDLETVIYPHFISGPLDAWQRLEFIRWHIEHHQQQLEAALAALAKRGSR
ncbi:MAG TPA: DinB family protein [Dehalococcoidia bacterium]|nr:DinB family protein [Dehalococcoidia bacterium]